MGEVLMVAMQAVSMRLTATRKVTDLTVRDLLAAFTFSVKQKKENIFQLKTKCDDTLVLTHGSNGAP